MKDERHKCIGCGQIISIYRAFCSKDCEEVFFKKHPETREDIDE